MTKFKDYFNQKGIYFGCAVNANLLETDGGYSKFVTDQFNIVTPENAMKFWAVHGQEGEYNFTQADRLVDFAQKNNLLIRGHTLIFHKNTPDWVKKYSDKNKLKEIFTDHMQTVTHHFAGKLYCWDVVNEAFDHHGKIEPNSIWQQYLGDRYLDEAFKLAHEADPTAKLFLNEWGAEPINKRTDAMYDYLKTALDKKIPVHGVGIQMHVALGNNKLLPDVSVMELIYKNLIRFSDLGLEIHITEMDIAIQSFFGTLEEKIAEQEKVYRDIFEVCKKIPNLKAIVQWGASDKESWIPAYTGQPDSPLLFDINYRQKFEL